MYVCVCVYIYEFWLSQQQQQLTAKQTIVIVKCVRQPLNPPASGQPGNVSETSLSIALHTHTMLRPQSRPPLVLSFCILLARQLALNCIVNSFGVTRFTSIRFRIPKKKLTNEEGVTELFV